MYCSSRAGTKKRPWHFLVQAAHHHTHTHIYIFKSQLTLLLFRGESFKRGSPGIERCVKRTSHSFSGKHDIQSSWLMSSFRMGSISSLDHIKAVALYKWIQRAAFENKMSWSADWNRPCLSETTDNTAQSPTLCKAELTTSAVSELHV